MASAHPQAAPGRQPHPAPAQAPGFAPAAAPAQAVNALGEAVPDPQITEALVFAAKAGKLGFIRERLAEGVSPDARLGDGWSALMAAAKEGHQGCLKALLDAGAPVDGRDRYGRTALMAAVVGDSVACIERLLRAGADLEAVDHEGRSALATALRKQRFDAAIALIKARADAHAIDDESIELAVGLRVAQGGRAILLAHLAGKLTTHAQSRAVERSRSRAIDSGDAPDYEVEAQIRRDVARRLSALFHPVGRGDAPDAPSGAKSDANG